MRMFNPLTGNKPSFSFSFSFSTRGMCGAQNVAEGEGSDTGTVEPNERTAELQRLQGEVRMLQEAASNIGMEVQWVAQGGSPRLRVCRGRWRTFGARSGGFRNLHRS